MSEKQMLNILPRLEVNLSWNEQSSVKEKHSGGTYLDKKITEGFSMELTCKLKCEFQETTILKKKKNKKKQGKGFSTKGTACAKGWKRWFPGSNKWL